MKYSYLIILFICMVSCKENNFAPRFLIVENGKTGFIDSSGKVIVKPQFHDAGDFSEGMANVRINGRYGYIDENGQFVIKPTYEYGTPFSEGLALVFNEGKSFFIDVSGKRSLTVLFRKCRPSGTGVPLFKQHLKNMVLSTSRANCSLIQFTAKLRISRMD